MQVSPGIKRMERHSIEFVNGKVELFDAVVLATGYRSNVPSWLKVHTINFHEFEVLDQLHKDEF